jgi:hypothetical protein
MSPGLTKERPNDGGIGDGDPLGESEYDTEHI